jgi:hypothetical protein
MTNRSIIFSSVVAAAVFALFAAGCGSSGSPGVASVGSSTTGAATATQSGAVAFARCMRSHGVGAFPDPNKSGQFDGVPLKRLRVPKLEMRSAQSACNHLLPNGMPMAGVTISQADRSDYLAAAACMRRHGLPHFPDPTFPAGGVKFTIPSSINQNSPLVQHALPICRKLIPAGLPYSGTS